MSAGTTPILGEEPEQEWFRSLPVQNMDVFFSAACREYSTRPAYQVDAKWITYADCESRVKSIAGALSDVLCIHHSPKQQPVIAILLPNSHHVLELFYVAALTRSIVFPINHRLSAAEIEVALRTSGAVILITSGAFSAVLSEIGWSSLPVRTAVSTKGTLGLPLGDQRSWQTLLSSPPWSDELIPDRNTGDYLQGFSTSGTTGKTKTVLHTHRSVLVHSLASIEALALNFDDDHCWGHIGPMFHVGDAVFVWISMLLGARHVFSDNNLHVREVLRLLSAERVTIVKLVPSMLQLMCGLENDRLDFSSLRWILTGGAAPNAALVRKTSELFGCDFIQGYGMTEATCHIAFKVETRSPPTEGLRVLPGLDLRIIGLNDEPLQPEEAGEIAIKGESVFSGYVSGGDLEVGNREGFTQDGYYRTGDLGYLDRAGELHIVGRSKDMINVGGENVFAREVEEAISAMPGVKECAAFPVRHEMLGEIVGVAVVCSDRTITDEQVKTHVRTRLATFKTPQRVFFLGQLPRTSTGKVQKHLLIEILLSAAETNPTSVVEASLALRAVGDLVDEIVTNYMRKLSPHPITDDQSLFDAGLDSLGAIELIEQLERRFLVKASPTLLYDHPTLRALKLYFTSNVEQVPGIVAMKVGAAAPDTAASTAPTHRQSTPGIAAALFQAVGLCVRPAVMAFSVLPVVILVSSASQWLSFYQLFLLGPVCFGLLVANTMAAVLLLRYVVGEPGRRSCDLWSSDYYRWLFLHNLFRSLETPLGVLRGTALLAAFYRLAGAKIGKGVRLHSVALTDLSLVEIGDRTIIGRDANLQPAVISDGVLGREAIRIGSNCRIGPHASILGGAKIPDGSVIPALSVVSGTTSQASSADAKLEALQTDEDGIRQRCLQGIGYLIVGYAVTAATSAGFLFVRSVMEGLGSAVPSISNVFIGVARPTSLPITFFAAVAVALYLVIPLCYFSLTVAVKRLFLRKIVARDPRLAEDGVPVWSSWLYRTLIEVPFFRMYLRLTVGSHATKWSFQLLGSRIGSRPFLAAPYTAEPELLEMGDSAMLAGNVSLYGIDPVERQPSIIRLERSAIVANSCVLQAGAVVGQEALLGDLSTAGTGNVIPPGSIAVGAPPRIVGRTNFGPDTVSQTVYACNQAILIIAQIAFLTAGNVTGFCIMGLLLDRFVLSLPVWALWCAAPLLVLVPRLIKLGLVPVFKWSVLGNVTAREHIAYGWYYTRWVLLETVMWDIEDAVLSQLHGMPLLATVWRSLGARVGTNTCLFSSSLACEYDLKEIGDNVVMHHQSLVFSHSIERHTLLFRPTHIGDRAEIGSFTIIEAGAAVGEKRRVDAHTPIHASVPRASTIAKLATAPGEANAAREMSKEGARDALRARFQALHEFVKAARENLHRNDWDYLIGAAETETTYARNRLALDMLGLQPRVLRDVSRLNWSTTLFGKPLRLPVLCAPIGSLESFAPGGAAAVAEAAREFGTGLIVSSVTQPNLERSANAAGDALKVFQLYVRGDQAWVDDYFRRAIASGYDAICLTVDTDLYSRRERDIAKRHERARVGVAGSVHQERFNWWDVERLKAKFDVPLILKGIATADDARTAIEHGVDCVYVSNHGGRQLDHGLGTAVVLPKIVDAVAGRAKILVDGAISRGTDVAKTLALGADAVAIGRLHVYGLAAAGALGVVRLLEILEDEFRIVLGLLGVNSVAELNASYLAEAPPVMRAHLHSAFPLLDLPREPY